MTSEKEKTIMALAIVLMIISFGCENEIIPESDTENEFDSIQYNLVSPDNQKLVGGSTIPRRADSFQIAQKRVPRILFASYLDEEVKNRLRLGTRRILGIKKAYSDVIDNGSVFSLDLNQGTAWCARGTGALAVKIHGYKVGPTEVQNAEDAVNRALDQVAKSGLLTLAEDETLDVISIQSTHHAGWFNVFGKPEPVYFGDVQTGERMTHFKSEYTVNFGRRFNGIPIIGPTLTVRLDANGRMAAFIKGWRNIVEVVNEPIELLSDQAIQNKKDINLVNNLVFKSVICGYVEAPGIGTHQELAGVGCRYVYYNPDGVGTLNQDITEWINIAADESLTLKGERVDYKPAESKDPPESITEEDEEEN